MMNRKFVQAAQAAMMVVVLGAMPMLASARGAGAILGNPASAAAADCFSMSSGGVTNVCSTTQSWIIPSLNDSSGSQTFQVRARGINGTTRRVSCRAFSVDSNQGNLVSSGEVPTVRLDGGTENLPLPVGVHGFGATWARCTMDPGTFIHNAHY